MPAKISAKVNDAAGGGGSGGWAELEEVVLVVAVERSELELDI